MILALSTQAQKNNGRTKITNGFQINIVDAPYQVSLHRNGTHNCGGSIINNRFVLTAAHCVTGFPLSQLTVNAGITSQNNPENTRQQFTVLRTIVHPQYRKGAGTTPPNFDYALIEINGLFTFNNVVKPIELISPGTISAEAVNNIARVSGWGWTTANDPNSRADQLQAVGVPVISNSTADNQLNIAPITPQMIATGAVNNSRLGACKGDSGGPLVFRQSGQPDIQIGIVSWGTSGCSGGSNSASVYARVSAEINWINVHAWSIQGKKDICLNTTELYQLSRTNPGVTTTWQASSNAQIVSSNNQSVRINVNANGAAWVRAVMSNGVTLTKNIGAGKPFIDPFIQFENGAVGPSFYLCTTHTGNAYRFTTLNSVQTHQYRTKTTTGQVIYTSSIRTGKGGGINGVFPSEGWYAFEVRGTNACGTSTWVRSFVEYRNCSVGGPIGPGLGTGFAIFPNPVSPGKPMTFLDVQALQNNVGSNQAARRQSIEKTVITIYNPQQQRVFTATFKENQYQLDLSKLNTGVYYMRVQKGSKTAIKKIFVK